MSMILVVEDEYAIAELILELLEGEGYMVALAVSGQDGVAQVPQVQPDLILADLMMPGLDGIGMCQQIQAHPAYRSIPIVLMTAGGIPPTFTNQCHFAAFIHKPFQIDELLDTVAHHIKP